MILNEPFRLCRKQHCQFRRLMFAVVACSTVPMVAWAHESDEHQHHHGVVGDWLFRPQYTLPGNAKHLIQSTVPVASTNEQEFQRDTLALRLAGHAPTERVRGLVAQERLPTKQFSFETWFNHHVNQPIGFAAVAGGTDAPQRDGWALAYHNFGGESRIAVLLGANGTDSPLELAFEPPRQMSFKRYWCHVVLTVDEEHVRLYVNGQSVSQVETDSLVIDYSADADFEMLAYLANEPYMQLANLVHHARLYDYALSLQQIKAKLSDFQDQIERGLIYPDVFHFTAGPYLNYVTQESMALVWETDTPATAKIEWGITAELGKSATIDEAQEIQDFTIPDLKPHTPYFYRITCTNEAGEELSSGVLTFQTAVLQGEPFRFAVIGDTETRPHINHVLAERIWGERPSFIVNLGDLTDGGTENYKFEWNLEYFTGLAGLLSRVPTFPVPGNGEDDLYWYKKYHTLPDDKSPYSFRYGDAEFFMLDSNLKRTEFVPGGRQYEWLESRLQNSNALWKFICFHHAPYTSEEDDYGNSWTEISTQGDPEIRPLVPLFEKYGVDMVMFGHLHGYERSRPIKSNHVAKQGVVYLLAGGGGGNLEDFAPNPVAFSSKVYRGHHYCTINIEGGTLELRMLDLTGAMRDFYRIDKENGGHSSKHNVAHATE